jgi:hypothetical protein
LLKFAIAIVIAGGASSSVLVEKQFEEGFADFPNLICVGSHDQSIFDLKYTGRLQAPLALDLNKAQSA